LKFVKRKTMQRVDDRSNSDPVTREPSENARFRAVRMDDVEIARAQMLGRRVAPSASRAL